MKAQTPTNFEHNYQRHIKHLKLKGMRPKTIEAYSHAVRRAGKYFQYEINALTQGQLTDYFADLLASCSWSTVKRDLYGMKFYYAQVLQRPWPAPDLIKPPRMQRLPDIITPAQAQRIFMSTKVLSYRVFFFTIYSMGLRLGEGLRLQIGDIDADRKRVHIRDAKGNKDRLVPLPDETLKVLRRFWAEHRNPVLLFPSRAGGRDKARTATHHMDHGGIQTALRAVTQSCGLKKELPRIACATVMLRT